MRQVKSINYAEIDLKIANDVKFYFDYDPNSISDGEGLTKLSEEANILLGPLAPFPVQFAPKITGDNKAGNYSAPKLKESNVFYSEPKSWNGASDRKLNFKLTYIADGGKWSYKTIKNIAHFSKSLLYMNKLASLVAAEEAGEAVIRAPILVIEKLYGIIEEKSTWALNTIDITHGEKIIQHEDGLFGPIKTEISFSCSEWTRIQDGKEAVDPNLAIFGLVDKPTVLWY